MFTEQVIQAPPSLVGNRTVWYYTVWMWDEVIYQYAWEGYTSDEVEVMGREKFLSRLTDVLAEPDMW